MGEIYHFYGVKPSFLYKKDGFTPWTHDIFPTTMDDFQRSIGFSYKDFMDFYPWAYV